MLLPDILLNSRFDGIAIIVSIIGLITFGYIVRLIASGQKTFASYADRNSAIVLCVFFFLLCLASLIIFGNFLANSHVYQLLREQSEPSSWETYHIASDFNRGHTRFMLGLLLIFEKSKSITPANQF